jgi:hypothetical protein
MSSTVSGRADIDARTTATAGAVRSRRNRLRRPIPPHGCGVELAESDELQGARVEIRIGIINTGRELSFDTGASADEVRTQVSAALEQSSTHLNFSDVKGNSYLVPTANLAYIELGTEESRRVGFVA